PSPAPPAPAHSTAYPMAKPGYGKRSAPDQRPRTGDDFALLPTRERYVAGFVDHLPEGAAMSVKHLAKQLPLYGQQAISTALNALSVAGHLRRVRCTVGAGDETRWVFRTFWSRTAHDNEWWNTYLATEGAQFTACTPQAPAPAPTSAPAPAPVPASVPQQRTTPPTRTPTPAPPPPAPAPARAPEPAPSPPPTPAPPLSPDPSRDRSPTPSPAYLALAQLGNVDHRVALSAADCTALEGLAASWLERGVGSDYLVHALTAGLPRAVDSPVGFVRRRLQDKIPPHLPAAGPAQPPPPGAPVHGLLVECTACRVPGRPEALPDGLCRPCRSDTDGPEERTRDDGLPVQRDIGAYVSELRERLRLP
ncbi:MarR family transcriptional regulator, partial [Streptomyces sp. NPDC007346]|uniref:MarR family transcriptional regulator n=1 Tax=Streptomyces sp. NPDC007346 TaxID=3154682 RepID=UPI00345509F7